MEHLMPSNVWTERCLGQVRWVNVVGYGAPTLQQAWEIIRMDDRNEPYQAHTEWRDVPSVDGAD
jgi:hypothetical protein